MVGYKTPRKRRPTVDLVDSSGAKRDIGGLLLSSTGATGSLSLGEVPCQEYAELDEILVPGN